MPIPSLVPAPAVSPTLEDRLAAAERQVRNYCGWHIAPVAVQDLVLHGSGSRSLFVPSLRIVEVVSCSVDGQDIDPATLEWAEEGFLRRSCGVWPDRLRSVLLTIRHGFDDAPDVSALIYELAERSMTAKGGRVREAAGGVSITNATVATGVAGGVVLMEHEKVNLEPYRIHPRV